MKKSEKLWQGAFSGAEGEIISFNSGENIVLDEKLIIYDILGNLAHVKMLAKASILTKQESDEISRVLKEVYNLGMENRIKLDPALEDVHSNIEAIVSKKTNAGKKMHTARSRNDQVLLDLRLYMRDGAIEFAKGVLKIQESLKNQAAKKGLMVAYTHTRVAQPITISFWAQSIASGLERDIDRTIEFLKRVNKNPLGACAISGTSWPIDRKYTAELLGFDGIEENEMDAINSRGELEAELLWILSMHMTRLSGISEELIWLSQKELIKIPDKYCTGSSIMPNKKNPDVLELIRARAAKVNGSLNQVLSIKKGLISGYHSDLQETKGCMMESLKTAISSTEIISKILEDIEFEEEKITLELENGYAQATEIADTLARKGISFRDAHGIVGKLVFEAKSAGKQLSQIKPPKELTQKEWDGAIELERKRLERKIELDSKKELEIKQIEEKIEKAFEALLR
ncbi:argininosuccinate lyase [Candidatus Micrarchaeota archaeon]|nr:argininosuccinate lyase [Candidatus Micrarchaeota archaeon]